MMYILGSIKTLTNHYKLPLSKLHAHDLTKLHAHVHFALAIGTQQNCLGGAGIFTASTMAELLLQDVITGFSWHVEVAAAATTLTATSSFYNLPLTSR
jgi:hypothetical protein